MRAGGTHQRCRSVVKPPEAGRALSVDGRSDGDAGKSYQTVLTPRPPVRRRATAGLIASATATAATARGSGGTDRCAPMSDLPQSRHGTAHDVRHPSCPALSNMHRYTDKSPTKQEGWKMYFVVPYFPLFLHCFDAVGWMTGNGYTACKHSFTTSPHRCFGRRTGHSVCPGVISGKTRYTETESSNSSRTFLPIPLV